jgi:hypothetical protein
MKKEVAEEKMRYIGTQSHEALYQKYENERVEQEKKEVEDFGIPYSTYLSIKT